MRRSPVIPNISETQSISKLAYSGFRFVSVLLLRSRKAAQLVFKAGLVAPAKVITVDFWQAKPPQQQPYYRHALSTATAFYSTILLLVSALCKFDIVGKNCMQKNPRNSKIEKLIYQNKLPLLSYTTSVAALCVIKHLNPIPTT